MKTILAVALASLFAVPAFAQTASSGTTHMVEFNADSVLSSAINLTKTKRAGSSVNDDVQFKFAGGYAYQLPTMPRLQLGGRLAYDKGTNTVGGYEDYGFQVGAILNHKADLMDTAYVSLYTGWNWNRQYGTAGNPMVENWKTNLAIGKRMPLTRFGVSHVVWQPELALVSENGTNTTNRSNKTEYTQNIEFRIVQFSVFF
jgi:hypothetical protein